MEYPKEEGKGKNGGGQEGAGAVAASRFFCGRVIERGQARSGQGGEGGGLATPTGVLEKALGLVGEKEMVAFVCTLASLPALRQTSKPPAHGEAGAGTGSWAATGRATRSRSRGRLEKRPGGDEGKQQKIKRGGARGAEAVRNGA